MTSERKKGHFTFRTCAVLFMASAVLELLSITSEAPLFGAIRDGITAGIYHLFYVALFLALGIGLWSATRWGYTLVYVTTAVYTLDKLQLVLSREALQEFVKIQMIGFESQLQMQGINEALIVQAIAMMAAVVILCWWGFALYTYWRRDYFKKDGF
ncbi:MAG: hypothetical protein OEN49_11190 [Gammaproteobacteria bacterium]|nr:hypothetical protein [Gammaproteobacteria bacterium]